MRDKFLSNIGNDGTYRPNNTSPGEPCIVYTRPHALTKGDCGTGVKLSINKPPGQLSTEYTLRERSPIQNGIGVRR